MLCILARELAVGANNVDVLVLAMLLVLVLPTSFARTPDEIPCFFSPIEFAVDVPRELAVPLELVLDPRVPPAPTRLFIRDIPLKGFWNEGIAPRRAAGIPEIEEAVLERVIPDEAVLDFVPPVEFVPFVPILVEDFLPSPIFAAGTRKLELGSSFPAEAFTAACFGTLVFRAGAGLLRTFGTGFLAAGSTVLCTGPGTVALELGLGGTPPTPLQTFLTRLFADERKPNLVAIPFFAENNV